MTDILPQSQSVVLIWSPLIAVEILINTDVVWGRLTVQRQIIINALINLKPLHCVFGRISYVGETGNILIGKRGDYRLFFSVMCIRIISSMYVCMLPNLFKTF